MMANSVPSIKGNQIGPWKLGETLGLGSTGKVHIAHNKTSGQQAAIKIISKAVFNNSSNAPSSIVVSATPDSLPYGIEREIIIMKLLNHPNVLRLYDVWETNANLYMVLEYAQKGELFNLLVERGPLPENEAITFFRQIIIGISYCHALGIVHRDLKPENLLLDHKYNIKIADFGMAALETEDRLLETSCGSPHYAAPEIVSGIPYHGFASDIWSCGVILFALLTGRLPFDEDDGNIRNLLLKVQCGKFEMPGDDEISHEAQDLIRQILVVDPESRIKARDILKHPLLQKYPSIKDSKSIRNLPREDTYLNPLSEDNSTIDSSILQNLVVLWHGRDSAEIAQKLKESGANAEKTLYALLSRFKRDTEQENIKNEQLRKRQSMTASSAANRSPSRSPHKKNLTPRKKSRMSMISVASSHKKPISFNRLSSVVHTTPSGSLNDTPRTNSSMRMSVNKRLSMLSTSNHNIAASINGSPIAHSRAKRTSVLQDVQGSKISRRASRSSKRLSFMPKMKRGSITTKLISTYAKLAEDDDWEYIEKETKRTSSDFATLIDEIFEHEKYEQIRKEKAELARKVAEAKKLVEEENRRRQAEEIRKIQESARIEKEKLKHQSAMDREIELLKQDLDDLKASADGAATSKDPEFRSVSAPLASDKAMNSDKVLRQRNYSLQTRPVSRLDPGLFFNKNSTIPEEAEEEEVQIKNVNPEKQRLKTERIILETIRRSKFLGSSFDINRELKVAETKQDRIASTASYKTQVLPKNAIATAPLKVHTEDENPDARKISDIRVPQFTRKSRNFSESNKRLSVLSMYSTRQSFTNLVDILKNTDTVGEGNPNQSTPPQSGGDSDLLFEAVNEDTENTANSSTEEKGYNRKNAEAADSKPSLKLNFADRYTNTTTEPSVNDTKRAKAELPKLPPLTDKTNGLGIYQAPGNQDESVIESEAHQRQDILTPKEEQQPTYNNNSMIIDQNINEIEEIPKTPVQKDKTPQQKGSLTVPKQREQDENDSRKSSGKSFFRKFSGSTTDFTETLYTTVSSKQLYDGLQHLLRGWTKYGLKNVKSNTGNSTITGKLANDNILSLRSTVFEVAVKQPGKYSSVIITKKSGSTKAVKRLFTELQNVLKKEGVLREL